MTFEIQWRHTEVKRVPGGEWKDGWYRVRGEKVEDWRGTGRRGTLEAMTELAEMLTSETGLPHRVKEMNS